MLRGSQAPRRAVCGTRGSLRTMHGGGSAPSCRAQATAEDETCYLVGRGDSQTTEPALGPWGQERSRGLLGSMGPTAGTPHPTKVTGSPRSTVRPYPTCHRVTPTKVTGGRPLSLPAPQRMRTRLTPQPGKGGLALEHGATCPLGPDGLRLHGRALTRLRFKVFQVYLTLML